MSEAIKVTTNKGEKYVPAWRHPQAPGLVVTMASFGEFEVTHEPTGLKLSGGFERFGEALLALVKCELIAKSCEFTWSGLSSKEEAGMILKRIKDSPMPAFNEGSEPETVGKWLQTRRLFEGVGQMLGYPWEDQHPIDKALELLPMEEVSAAASEVIQ